LCFLHFAKCRYLNCRRKILKIYFIIREQLLKHKIRDITEAVCRSEQRGRTVERAVICEVAEGWGKPIRLDSSEPVTKDRRNVIKMGGYEKSKSANNRDYYVIENGCEGWLERQAGQGDAGMTIKTQRPDIRTEHVCGVAPIDSR
jgi:hypothetical protein